LLGGPEAIVAAKMLLCCCVVEVDFER
jgi:hypothetical protein